MTQWNRQRCGGEPLGGKRSGTCCCSYCEGYQAALEGSIVTEARLRFALRNIIELAGAATATAWTDEARAASQSTIDAARELLTEIEEVP